MAEQGMVERVALALHGHEESWNDHTWEQLPPGTQEAFLGQANAVIAALPDDRASICRYLTAEATKRKASRIESRVLRAMVDAVKAGLDRG